MTSTYDPLGRLLTRVTGTRAAYAFTYNRAGNRLTEASTISGDPGNGTAVTGYDQLDRLTSYALPGIRTLGSTFDAVPNRTGLTTDGVPSSQAFDAANRPTGAYTYDADGRMTGRPGSSGGSLEWDTLGRLIRVRVTPGGAIVAAYTYDALDRLLTVERAGTRIRFRYAGTTTAPAQVLNDATLTVLRNVVTGPQGTVLADWLGTDRRLYGTNGHQDVTWTADDTGAVTATARYDPWGNVTRSSGATLPDWRFQGSWADTSTGLAWSIARWCDPAEGTFISEDAPLGEPANPASRHLYAYGAGEPLGSWDPGGQFPYTLNPYEQRLCDLHPGQCVAWGEASFWAGKLASFYWKDPIRNTMRHCMWSRLMSYSMGKVNAYVWARAHEYGSHEGPPYTDMRVDLHNNYVGRVLGAHLSEVWYIPVWKTARELCVGAWNRGWLWFNRGDKIYWSNGQYIKNAPFKWYP